MKTKHAAIAAVAACTILSGTAIGGMSDFIINNTRGDLYRVDGQTLEATQISSLDAFQSLNEIMFDGGSSILYNDGSRIVRHNFVNQQEAVLLDTTIGLGTFPTSAGLARASNGDLFYSSSHSINSAQIISAITADLNTQTTTVVDYTEYHGFFDHHTVGEDLYIGATYTENQIVFTQGSTGVVVDQFAVGASIVSFFESSDGLFGLTKEGAVHSIDLDNRTTSFYGQVNGAAGNLIGATIPTPSSIVPLAISVLAVRRRRR